MPNCEFCNEELKISREMYDCYNCLCYFNKDFNLWGIFIDKNNPDIYFIQINNNTISIVNKNKMNTNFSIDKDISELTNKEKFDYLKLVYENLIFV